MRDRRAIPDTTNDADPLLPTSQTGAEKNTNVAHPLLPTPLTGAEKATNVAVAATLSFS